MPQNRILLGVIGRPHGVRGLVRVTSHTADPAALTAYGPLSDDRGRRFVLHWRSAGLAEVEEISGGSAVKVADRTAAEKLTNTRLYIDRAQLPEPDAEEFYLADLIGMTAADAAGAVLGKVASVHDYGAGASLEIIQDGAAPLLVPFTRAAVPEVDLVRGRLTVEPPVALAHDMAEAEAPDQAGEGGQRSARPARTASRPEPARPRRARLTRQPGARPGPAASGRGAQP